MTLIERVEEKMILIVLLIRCRDEDDGNVVNIIRSTLSLSLRSRKLLYNCIVTSHTVAYCSPYFCGVFCLALFPLCMARHDRTVKPVKRNQNR